VPVRRALKIAASAIAALALCAAVVIQPACADGNSAATTSATDSTTANFPSTTEQPVVDITIAAVGDVMVHKATLRAARHAGTKGAYDFKPTFAQVAPYLRMADYTVVNLETRLAGPRFNYTSYPRFNSPGELTDALTMCGVDLCATANNHSLDKDWPGIVNTLDRLDAAGIAHVGTYRTAEEKSAPFIVDIKGIKVAFINYTDYLNGFTPPTRYAVNLMYGPEQVAADARAAREAGADVVIAVLHWGKEYVTKANRKQTNLAEGSGSYPGLLAEGVDVILGSHPHVVQRAVGVVRDTASGPKNAYVVYSMGNFLSDMIRWRTDSGVIVYVHIQKRGQEVKVTGLSYMGVYIQQVGSYPRGVRIVPVLPEGAPATGAAVSARQQSLMNKVRGYLDEKLYDPDTNILPVAPADIAGAD
jgi:poly-gamma-glutamate capsule biosynthesis protein CapA/YwtB (metallophosphatase superfamily)